MDPQKYQRNQAKAATALLGVKQDVTHETAGKPGANSGRPLGTRPEQSANESGVSPTLLSQGEQPTRALDEGEKCPHFGPTCCGRLRLTLNGECTCAFLGRMAPCSACEESYLVCDDCGHEVRS